MRKQDGGRGWPLASGPLPVKRRPLPATRYPLAEAVDTGAVLRSLPRQYEVVDDRVEDDCSCAEYDVIAALVGPVEA